MSLNTKEFATKFTGELDKILCEKTAVGFMTDNTLRAKFVGAKSVKIPQIDLTGLCDYDRKNGFISGCVNITNQVFTMQQDRARSFSIDREDMDETGIAQLAGSILGEFVRTRVVPETDAYVLSKLAGVAATRNQLLNGADVTKPYECFSKLLTEVQSAVGYDEEIVCFVNPYIWQALRTSSEFAKYITVGNFTKGQVTTQVHMIDNVPIIPVSYSRMQTAFEFLSGSGENDGGYKTADGARGIYMLMLPKKAASLVRKSENIRTFSPEQNPNADAYKFDYRLYYDVFVKSSYLSGIWAITAPSITISANLADSVTVKEGSISKSLSVTATADGGTAEYQWFSCENENKLNPAKIAGATSATMAVDTALTNGEYYYFVRVSVGGATVADSNVCKVIVE